MMRSNKLGVDFSYVILDDESDMLYEQSKYFICCDSMEGLTLEQANKVIGWCMRRFACRNFQITTDLNSKLSYTPCCVQTQ